MQLKILLNYELCNALALTSNTVDFFRCLQQYLEQTYISCDRGDEHVGKCWAKNLHQNLRKKLAGTKNFHECQHLFGHFRNICILRTLAWSSKALPNTFSTTSSKHLCRYCDDKWLWHSQYDDRIFLPSTDVNIC